MSLGSDVNRNVNIYFTGHDRASSAMRSISSTATSTTKTAGLLTSSLKRMALTAGSAFAAFAGFRMVFGFFKSSVDMAGDFQQSLNVLNSVLGLTGDQMKAMQHLALQMGNKTVYSANEAADAMVELAKGGLSEAQIKAGALKATMQLAATEGLNLADAGTTLANTMSSFSIKAKDASTVADILAGASMASTASVDSLRMALAQVGPGAQNAGLSLNETVAALAAFDAAGIKSSDAGTSLKTMLTRLVPTTDTAGGAMHDLGIDFTNADGSMKSLTQIAQILQDKMGGLSDEARTAAMAQIFGSDATRAATVLMKQGAEGIKKYIKATEQSGAAAKMAHARMKGWDGALELLSGAVDTLKTKVGLKLLPVLTDFVKFLAHRAVPWLQSKLVPAVKDAAHWLGTNLPNAAKKISDWWNGDGKSMLSDWVGLAHDLGGQVAGVSKAVGHLSSALGELTGKQSTGDSTSFFHLLYLSIDHALIPLKAYLWFLQHAIDAWAWIIDHAADIISKIGAIGDAFSSAGSWVTDPMSHLPSWAHASGGTLHRATGGSMGGWNVVGEHGPELINGRGWVKSHSQSMGAGGGGVVINVNGAIDPVGTARQIRNILAKGDRVGGRATLGLA